MNKILDGFRAMAKNGRSDDEDMCVYDDTIECPRNFNCASCKMRESDDNV